MLNASIYLLFRSLKNWFCWVSQGPQTRRRTGEMHWERWPSNDARPQRSYGEGLWGDQTQPWLLQRLLGRGHESLTKTDWQDFTWRSVCLSHPSRNCFLVQALDMQIERSMQTPAVKNGVDLQTQQMQIVVLCLLQKAVMMVTVPSWRRRSVKQKNNQSPSHSLRWVTQLLKIRCVTHYMLPSVSCPHCVTSALKTKRVPEEMWTFSACMSKCVAF